MPRGSAGINLDSAGVHGAALLAQGKIGEAIDFFERSVALNPDLPAGHENLAKAYMAAGKPELAIDASGRALELKETAERKMFFAHCVKSVRFVADDGRFRKLVLRALGEGWARPRELTGVCISLIKLNAAVGDGIARANAAWPMRLPARDLFGAAGLAALCADDLLCRLLECDPITDIGLERLLTNVRYALLTSAEGDDGGPDTQQLRFCAALARQCFINQYVYAIGPDETEQAKRLRSALERALAAAAAGPCSAHWPAIVGAYFPLRTLSAAEALQTRTWPQCVEAVIVQQVAEPAQEHRIAATIPALTGIDGEVSERVRQQYEESPYPLWTKAPAPLKLPIGDEGPPQVFDALIAGCGTGLSTIEFARQARGARVLGIDLSLASLCYAKRMAQGFGLTNVEFAQADIMKSAAIGRQFDVIDASGVLHHLADPWQGWRELASLLRPGGAMQLGLYSELARPNIVAARALIAARGYRPVADDIRRCRDDILSADDPLLKSVIQWEDFFATNECRDLLFHVQEQRTTLREIKTFLEANGLQFAGFNLDAAIVRRFAARFPEPAALTDLDRWHAFEIESPNTFAAMYRFWVHKPAAGAVGSGRPGATAPTRN
jgi:SAM-dependent methyltransferase